MLELGSRKNTTGMDTKRARGKCIANVVVCQLCLISCYPRDAMRRAGICDSDVSVRPSVCPLQPELCQNGES